MSEKNYEGQKEESPNQSREIKRLVSEIKNRAGKVVVLIGAGCSYSAGIPLATEMAKEIKDMEFRLVKPKS